MKFRLLLLLAAIGVTLVVAAPAMPTTNVTVLTGTFRTVIKGKSAPLNGSWTIKVDQYTQSVTTHNGKLAVKGTFTGANGKLAVVDLSGPYACKGVQAAGAYTYTLSGNKLKLKATFDQCSGRKTILTAQPLTKSG